MEKLKALQEKINGQGELEVIIGQLENDNKFNVIVRKIKHDTIWLNESYNNEDSAVRAIKENIDEMESLKHLLDWVKLTTLCTKKMTRNKFNLPMSESFYNKTLLAIKKHWKEDTLLKESESSVEVEICYNTVTLIKEK